MTFHYAITNLLLLIIISSNDRETIVYKTHFLWDSIIYQIVNEYRIKWKIKNHGSIVIIKYDIIAHIAKFFKKD